MLTGRIAGLSQHYVDGPERMEIHVKKHRLFRVAPIQVFHSAATDQFVIDLGFNPDIQPELIFRVEEIF